MAKPRVPKSVSDDSKATRQAESNEILAAPTNGNTGASKNGARKAVRQRITAKPAIVKSDLRATLVPINLEEEVRRLAYLMAERRGFEPGHEADDWFAAEREVRERYHQHSA